MNLSVWVAGPFYFNDHNLVDWSRQLRLKEEQEVELQTLLIFLRSVVRDRFFYLNFVVVEVPARVD